MPLLNAIINAIAAQHGASPDAASGPKIARILKEGNSPTVFSIYQAAQLSAKPLGGFNFYAITNSKWQPSIFTMIRSFNMPLRPSKTIHKALISTTSRLVGQYENDGLLITHAWPNFHIQGSLRRFEEGPTSRSAYVFVFETEPFEEQKGKPLPDYSPMGDTICSYLSVLFGKRFDNHGLIEGTGFFHLPDLAQLGHTCNHRLPQNSHSPRVDFQIPLNLEEFTRIEALLLDDTLDKKFLRTLQSTSKFYLQALQNAEQDPEVAYLHLITAGEILSNSFEYDKDLLLDERIRETLAIIEGGLPEGSKIANEVRNRLLQIKRRFVETICSLIGVDFFEHTEAKDAMMSFKSDTFRKSIAAAYDLRSRYVHTGVPFGTWVSFGFGSENNEVQIGHPVVEDKEFGKILAQAPTFIGLERVIRYCLMRYIHQNIAAENKEGEA